MCRYIILFVFGLTTLVGGHQHATAQDALPAKQSAGFEYHVIGDVQAPGAHVSSMEQEWLVNLLKVARLFPAESYQLRIIRDGKVEWDANVPSNQRTPSIQLNADDVLVVQSLSQTQQGLAPTSTDSIEVAFVIPGQPVELKSVQAGMKFAELAQPKDSGPLETLIPPSGQVVTSFPEQKQLQDGDVLVFAKPGAIGLPTMPQELASVDQTPTSRIPTSQQPAPQLMNEQLATTTQGPSFALPVIAAGNNSTPRIVSTSQSRTIEDVNSRRFDSPNNVMIVGNDRATEVQNDFQTVQRRMTDSISNGMNSAREAVESVNSEVQNQVDAFDQTTATVRESFTDTPSLMAPDLEPIQSFDEGVEVLTDPDRIRAAMQNEIDGVQDMVNTVAPGLEFDSSHESEMLHKNEITNRLGGTANYADSATSAINDVGSQAKSVVGGLKTSAGDLAATFKKNLTASAHDPETIAAQADESTRRKYSSVLFVLLLLGSITSLIFIWSKKNEQTLDTQFDKLKNYGASASTRVAAAGAAVTSNVANAVNTATDSLAATSAEVTTPVASAAASMMAAGQSRLDQLIHDRVTVSQEASRIQRTFELNTEPTGPKRYRIDAGTSPMQKGPHFRVPAATETTAEPKVVQQSTKTARVDRQPAPATRSHFSDLPEGRLDRALNSIEGVTPS